MLKIQHAKHHLPCKYIRSLVYSHMRDLSDHDIKYCRYVFGVTHIPRLEDWPVMPVERIGFMLMVFYSSQ